MRRTLIIGFFVTGFAAAICAQSSQVFEAAVVRPSGPDSTFQSKLTSTQFIATRHTLQMLIESSYPDLPDWRMSGGPPWATKDFWDLIAKLPKGAPADQEPLYRATEQMLRTLLADEFKLKTHFEQRPKPVYNLIVAKRGAKFKPSEVAERSFRLTATRVEIRHETIEEFASFLFCPSCGRQTADRPVLDKTGLTGLYDFTLNWAPANIQSDAFAAPPSIVTALEEQLGLKLQPANAWVDFLIIDQAERPSGN